MAGSVDGLQPHTSQRHILSVLGLLYHESVGLPLGPHSHHHRHSQLRMRRQEIGMVMREEDVNEIGSSFLEQVLVDIDVVGGIDECDLALGLDVVGEDGQLTGLELRYMEPGTVPFG